MKQIPRISVATAVLAAGLGLASLSVAMEAQAQPGPFPQWCPGDFWDPGWGNNWDGGRCHDDSYYDGEPHDQAHWHGPGPWHP